jgi:hypothetical protein
VLKLLDRIGLLHSFLRKVGLLKVELRCFSQVKFNVHITILWYVECSSEIDQTISPERIYETKKRVGTDERCADILTTVGIEIGALGPVSSAEVAA